MSADIHIRRLIKIFQSTHGNRSKIVVLTDALSDEGLTEDEAWVEADYMAGEGWVEIVGDNGPAWVRLTPAGIKTTEANLTRSPSALTSLPDDETNDESIVSYNFPKIKLSDAEQQWLGNICSHFLKGYVVDVDQLKKSLYEKGKWSKGFRPSEIDSRILIADNQPTLLGVWHAYPVNNKWISKCDELIKYIKGRIEASSSREIKVSEMARSLGMPERNTSVLIRLLPTIGLVYTATTVGTSHNQVKIPGEMGVYTSLRIDDPEKMDDYLSYEGIEEQVRKVAGEDDRVPVAQHKMANDNLILDRYELIPPLIGFKKNIENQLTRFPFEKNVFLMMKFRDSNKDLGDFIIENLHAHGLHGVRADANNWNITRNVYNPIAVLYCCKYGIALFDEPEKGQTYSPNVAYELGIMHYQQKECLILRHATLPAIPFDLIKDLYVTYEKDLQVKKLIADWVEQITSS